VASMRRYVVPPAICDFDARPSLLAQEINPAWEEQVKDLHRTNQKLLIANLCVELGSVAFGRKLDDYIALGNAPFSIISYHNVFLCQARYAFVQGHYYPALTAACALGERVLNHLILDLRDAFSMSREYKKLARQSSIVSWQRAINALIAWKILLPVAAKAFRKLETLRHRSLHFNPSTYGNLREDALAALKCLGSAIGEQFSAFGLQPWFIPGTLGACFVKAEYEAHPFIRAYFLKNCPLVGVNHAHSAEGGKWSLFDYKDYGEGRITDDEFRELYNNRDHARLAPTSLPPAEGIIHYQWHRVPIGT